MKNHSRWISPALILALPVIYVIVYLFIGNQKGFYYWTPNQDPDYAYLANSLLLVLFKVPGHTDHPGTPLQVLGAVDIWLGHGVRSLFNAAVPRSVADDVLTSPEVYLHLINFTLLFVTAIALFCLGWVAYRLCHNLMLTLILQLSPFLMIKPHLADEPSRVSADVLAFCISQLLALVLVRYLYLENSERSRKFALSLGAVMGLGMATKVTFLPMFLYFLLPQGWNKKAWAVGSMVGAFVIATLPIVSRYGRTFGWLNKLATNTGAYGGGEPGLIDSLSVQRNAALLLTRNPLFFNILAIATIACIAFALLWKLGKLSLQPELHPNWRKVYVLLGLTTLTIWVQVALTLKAQPESRYLDPSAGLMGLLIFLLIQLSLVALPVLSRSIHTRLVSAIALVLCVAISIQQMNVSFNQITNYANKRAAESATVESILQQEQYKSCLVMASRRASRPDSALKFADFWSGKQLGRHLQQLYPTAAFYISSQGGYQTFARKTKLASLGQNSCILLEVNVLADAAAQAKLLPQGAKKIFKGEYQALYQVKP